MKKHYGASGHVKKGTPVQDLIPEAHLFAVASEFMYMQSDMRDCRKAMRQALKNTGYTIVKVTE